MEMVAKELRKILDPSLTDNDVETIVVCLLAHLIIEQELNGLLYRWLKKITRQFRKMEIKKKP